MMRKQATLNTEKQTAAINTLKSTQKETKTLTLGGDPPEASENEGFTVVKTPQTNWEN